MADGVALTERLLFLRSVPLLRTLPAGVLNSVARTMVARAFARGEVLLREDEPGTSVHILTTGRVRLSRKGVLIGTLEAPNAVGFLPLMARMTDGFEVLAEAPTRTLEADADSVFELLEEQFDLLLYALRDTARLLSNELRRRPGRVFGEPSTEHVVLPARPLDVVERIFALRRMAPFRKVSIDALAVLSRSFLEERVGAGHVFWRSGDPSGDTLLILSGMLRVRDREGRDLGGMGPGTAVGGIESMAAHARWFDLVTVTPVVILRGTTRSLIEVMEDNHDMGRDFLAFTTKTLMAIWDERIAAGEPTDAIIRDMRSLRMYGAVPEKP